MAKHRTSGDVVVAIWLAIGLIALGLMMGDATIGLFLGVGVFLIAVYVMTRVRIHTTMVALLAGAFVLENPADGFASGQWSSPFMVPSAVLVNHINTIERDTLGSMTSWMAFSGMDLCFVVLTLVILSRSISHSKIDGPTMGVTPVPLVRLAWVSWIGSGLVLMSGMLRGGVFGSALWQLDRVVYLPAIFLLFQHSIRSREDIINIGKATLVGGTYRALLAYYIYKTMEQPPDEWGNINSVPCATSHHDSMLFASCIFILLSLVLERAIPKAKLLALSLAPILFLGMVANNRRMVWVQIAAAVVTLYFVSGDNPYKQAFRRSLKFVVPVIVIYLAAGWNAGGSKIWKPARMMKSVVDAETDSSSFWRELENYNLVATLRSNPFLGAGYGNQFTEYVELPRVDYPLEYILPHNSLLGLWCFGGVVGFTATTLLWPAGVYFAMRAYHATSDRLERAIAQVCFGNVFIYMISCWGDLGLGTWVGVYLTASSLAVGAKLAVANGQWNPAWRPATPFSIA